MRTHLTCLILTFLCTCVRAQQSSSGTMMVSLGENVIMLHISSASGYEQYNFVNEEDFARFPRRYRGFTPLRLNHLYDFTIVHQYLDSLAARGWELTTTNYSTAIDFSDLNTHDRERIYFHFKTPPRTLPPFKDPQRYTLLQEASLAPRVKNTMRGRIVRLNDGTASLVIERRLGNGWETTYVINDEGPVAGDQPERISGLRLDLNELWLDFEFANGKYSYKFDVRATDYRLVAVSFRSEEPCGLFSYELDIYHYGGPQLQGFARAEECEPSQRPRSISETVANAERVLLGSFFAGSYRVELEGPGFLLVY